MKGPRARTSLVIALCVVSCRIEPRVVVELDEQASSGSSQKSDSPLGSGGTSVAGSPPMGAPVGGQTDQGGGPGKAVGGGDSLIPCASDFAPAQPFEALAPVGKKVPGVFDLALSGNELTAYMAAGTPQVWTATRASLDDPFGEASPLPDWGAFDSPLWSVALAADSLSVCLGIGSWLSLATRGDADLSFSAYAEVLPPNQEEFYAHDPWLSSRGERLYSYSGLTLYQVEVRAEGGYGDAWDILPNSEERKRHPTLSADELTLYFGLGAPPQIAQATRNSIEEPFGSPCIIEALRSDLATVPAWLSPDSCRLYLARGGDGPDVSSDYLVAEKPGCLRR